MIVARVGAPWARAWRALWAVSVAGSAAACGPAPTAPVARPAAVSVAPAPSLAATPQRDPCEGAKGLAAGAWPMSGRCARHTSRGAAVGPSDPALLWRGRLASTSLGGPAIGADGTVFIGSSALYALDARGKRRTLAKEMVLGAPAIGPDGTLYVGNKGGLVAVSPAGVRRWSVAVGPVSGPPSIDARGTIYTTSIDRKVYAVGPDGALRWTFETSEPLHGTPLLDARGVLIATGSLGVWAIGERVRAPGENAPPPGVPPLVRRGFLTEDELFAPRPGERLCTTVRTVNHLFFPEPVDIPMTLRQFEDARGLVVRAVSTQSAGTKDSKSSAAAIRWDTRGNVTAVELDEYPADGLVDASQRWTYDARGGLVSVEHDEDDDGRPESTDRYEVSAKRAPTGATTGHFAIPERFFLRTPVTDAPPRIPGFEGAITRSEEGEGSHRLRRTYDARGWLVKEESWPTGAPASARPEGVTTFSRSAAGELLESREKVSNKDGARVRYRRAAGRLVEVVTSGAAEVETTTYVYDAAGKLTSAKQLEGKTVTEESEVERACE